eukprot:161213-Pleurochrysis_carterae.AAC.1
MPHCIRRPWTRLRKYKPSTTRRETAVRPQWRLSCCMKQGRGSWRILRTSSCPAHTTLVRGALPYSAIEQPPHPAPSPPRRLLPTPLPPRAVAYISPPPIPLPSPTFYPPLFSRSPILEASPTQRIASTGPLYRPGSNSLFAENDSPYTTPKQGPELAVETFRARKGRSAIPRATDVPSASKGKEPEPHPREAPLPTQSAAAPPQGSAAVRFAAQFWRETCARSTAARRLSAEQGYCWSAS